MQRIRCTYAMLYRDVICCHRYFTCSPNTCYHKTKTLKKKLNSVARVRERTIPTERPPTCYYINIKLKIVKLVKFHVISCVVSHKSGLINKIFKC
jgi:hypothetical protein